MTTPTPTIFANTKKPEPKPRPVKRKPGLSSHVDADVLRALRAVKGKKK